MTYLPNSFHVRSALFRTIDHKLIRKSFLTILSPHLYGRIDHHSFADKLINMAKSSNGYEAVFMFSTMDRHMFLHPDLNKQDWEVFIRGLREGGLTVRYEMPEEPATTASALQRKNVVTGDEALKEIIKATVDCNFPSATFSLFEVLKEHYHTFSQTQIPIETLQKLANGDHS